MHAGVVGILRACYGGLKEVHMVAFTQEEQQTLLKVCRKVFGMTGVDRLGSEPSQGLHAEHMSVSECNQARVNNIFMPTTSLAGKPFQFKKASNKVIRCGAFAKKHIRRSRNQLAWQRRSERRSQAPNAARNQRDTCMLCRS